jgi:hypothetical protein
MLTVSISALPLLESVFSVLNAVPNILNATQL